MRLHRWISFLIALGAAQAAWGQERSPTQPARPPAQRESWPAATAIAAFPDVAPAPAPRTVPARDPALELLEGDPYTEELAAIRIRENLFGESVDEEDPYAEQIRMANPYSGDPRLRTRAQPDLENPYARR